MDRRIRAYAKPRYAAVSAISVEGFGLEVLAPSTQALSEARRARVIVRAAEKAAQVLPHKARAMAVAHMVQAFWRLTIGAPHLDDLVVVLEKLSFDYAKFLSDEVFVEEAGTIDHLDQDVGKFIYEALSADDEVQKLIAKGLTDSAVMVETLVFSLTRPELNAHLINEGEIN